MTYSRNFWALSLGMFFFMVSFNLIIPELNEFITLLGGEAFKGLIIGLFTLTAAISRPFSGKMADIVGRKSTMYVGTVVSIIITLIYPLSGTITFFLTLRFFHGFSTGFLPTGATALVTDILPPEKRGQGMGVFGTGIALGLVVGQGLGTPIANTFSLNGLFIISSLTAVISLLLIHSVKETLPTPQPIKFSIFKINIGDVFEKNVLPAAMVMFLTTICTGLILVLTPDKSVYLGIENKGWYYVFYVVSTIAVRLFAGKLSDIIGRRQALIMGVSILIIAMLMTGFAETAFWYTSASFIFGIATGISSPTLFAWMADLSPTHRRGVGSGTLFIALEFGILFGAASTLSIYNNTPESLNFAFTFGAYVAGLALIYLILHLLFSRTNVNYKKTVKEI
ncbi:MFS transporter [Brumimicrobium mesophilum]|uniref:MFS transporter n=1 Tax=Brumimicrobium mesophilum TaxID=392717 RepID=UPI000D141A79|nr:MFS transporter [Brumimicrobium mesophilum]